MIKLVIFDLDGLLIDSERQLWIPNEIRAMKQLGYEVDIPFLYTLMGGAPKTNIEKYHKRYGKDFAIDDFYNLVHKYNEISVENGELSFKDGAEKLLDYLQTNKIDMCIGSSSKEDYVHKALRKLNVFDKFSHIITRNDVTNAKPYPDIYLKCMSLYEFEPCECLVLEDAHSGLLAAKAAGCRCILIPDLGVLSDYDRQNAYKVVDSLSDVIHIIEEENK